MKAYAIAFSSVALLAWQTPLAAQPTRYEACTTGISVEGLIDDLDLYGPGADPVGETEDLIIDDSGRVLALRAELGGFMGLGETHVSLPWRTVDVGETWVRSLALAEGVEGLTPLSDQALVQELVGSGNSETAHAYRASELIGDFVRTADGDDGFANLGVVDDLLIDKDLVKAVIIAPDAGLGFAEKYAVPFDDYLKGGWTPASTAFDLAFQQNEVEQIEAFDC